MFPWASQPDLVRSAQKDEFYRSHLRDQLHELASVTLGQRSQAVAKEVDFLADLGSLGLTTALGSKTLGEEYCDLLQVTRDLRLPSRNRRFALVALSAGVPYVVQRMRDLKKKEVSPDCSAWYRWFARIWNTIIKLLPQTEIWMRECGRLHILLFYWFGSYYEISKRFAGIRYIYTRHVLSPHPSYQILAVLIVAQLFISLMMATWYRLRQWISRRSKASRTNPCDDDDEEEEDEGSRLNAFGEDVDDDDPSTKCLVCFSSRVNRAPTVTECGHVFCWHCICEAINTKALCPMCRSPVKLSNLVRLVNFR